MVEQISVCLAALYLRGIRRPVNPARRKWSQIVSCLRGADCSLAESAAVLGLAGFWEESLVLQSEDTLGECLRLVETGSVLTGVDLLYPPRWLERLGQSAPPALWIQGQMPALPLLGIVGSRQVDQEVLEFAGNIGREAARLGYAVVSGGAIGCDTVGANGALSCGGYAVELLPHGIDLYDRRDRCGLSACAPEEEFSTAGAMERNTLIYAASEQTVVVHARFKAGGTWIGAVEATRRHICPLIVRDDGSPASRAMIGLGASPIVDPYRLAVVLEKAPAQRGLFGIG